MEDTVDWQIARVRPNTWRRKSNGGSAKTALVAAEEWLSWRAFESEMIGQGGLKIGSNLVNAAYDMTFFLYIDCTFMGGLQFQGRQHLYEFYVAILQYIEYINDFHYFARGCIEKIVRARELKIA
jgi:hypothetical protein